MGHKPAFLEAQWTKAKAVMRAEKLDRLTRKMVAVAVSAMARCGEPISVHTSAVRKLGLDDEAILEPMAVVDLVAGRNKFNEDLEVEPDEQALVR